MADTAFQIQFRQETIAAFEQTKSFLRDSVTTEAVFKGNQATFLVAGSGGARAVTRGANGLIPGRSDDLNQYTATLAEWHDKPTVSGFNIMASQGDRRRIMQQTSAGVMNRRVDEEILTILQNGTNNTGTATVGSLNLVLKARNILANNNATQAPITFVISPVMESYLLQAKEFSSAEYLNSKPFAQEAQQMFMWRGMNFIVHPELPGKGTANEKCFAYAKTAVGHAMDKGGIQTVAGYDDQHDYSYCRVSAYMGGILLQNSGVVVINHDGTIN